MQGEITHLKNGQVHIAGWRTPLMAGLVALFSAMAVAQQEPQLYGKYFASAQRLAPETGNAEWSVANHASRLGVKGQVAVDGVPGMHAFYQVEYGIALHSGDLSARNTFVGIRADWGRIGMGTYDTPFKKAQGKVDVFNDIIDINNVVAGDNRQPHALFYESARFGGGVKIAVMTVLKDANTDPESPLSPADALSLSISYKRGGLYAAVATDTAIDGWDGTRLVLTYKHRTHHFGMLYDTYKGSDVTGDKDYNDRLYRERDGDMVLSYRYKASDSPWGGRFMQAAGTETDTSAGTETDRQLMVAGADYFFAAKRRAFIYAGNLEVGDDTNDVLGVGMEFAF